MELRAELETRLQRTAASELDLAIDLQVGDEPPVRVMLANGKAWLAPLQQPRLSAGCPRAHGGDADATFFFDGAETAAAILYREGDFVTAFMDAFMAGRVRSDGNLPVAFTLLGLFRPGLQLRRPD